MHRPVPRKYAAAGAVAALLLASCKPMEYPEQFGLSPTSKGPEIRIAGCPPYAWSVQLALAGEPSDVLWRLAPIRDRPTNLPRRFLIGSVPEGWKEPVPLRRELASDVEYRIILSSGEAYGAGLDFSLGDLRPGYILDFDGNLIPTTEFPVRTTCQGRTHRGLDRAWSRDAGHATAAYMTLSNLALTAAMASRMLTS
jgi:hypothetical protein